MKKIWVYLLGVLSGVVLILIMGFIVNSTRSSNIRFFDKPGDIITIQRLTGETETVQSFEVFQALESGMAPIAIRETNRNQQSFLAPGLRRLLASATQNGSWERGDPFKSLAQGQCCLCSPRR